jgi:MerR family copper efflux transcriptional regulator
MTEEVMEPLTIGQVAKCAGVGVETIRFYEREGLIAQPKRRPSSGYRQYLPEAVRRVRFIRHAKELGFTLKEIQELLDLRVDPTSTCADVRKRARDKASDIEERIASLEQMKAALDRLARKCRGRGPTTECPILEELDREGDYDAKS